MTRERDPLSAYWSLPPEQIAAALSSGPSGLTSREAE